MAAYDRGFAFGAIAAAVLCASSLVGCSEGTDFEVNAPLLDAAGVHLMTNQDKKTADLSERAPLVTPPSYDLPEPGTPRAAMVAEAKLPNDPEQRKKSAEEKKKADREKYCREGDWSGKGGIGEFNKATGQEHRCPSKMGEALNSSFSNTSHSKGSTSSN
jgi:hypothetical protein